MIGLTACGNKEPEYSLEFIEGKTVTIEDNEYVGALLLCASGLYTLHDVLQKNDWNEHEIENRAEWLLANAQNIWKI